MIPFMIPFVDLLSGAYPLLLDVALKGTAFLIIAACAALLARKSSAATRSMFWTIALGALLVLPALALLLPGWRVLPLRSAAPSVAIPGGEIHSATTATRETSRPLAEVRLDAPLGAVAHERIAESPASAHRFVSTEACLALFWAVGLLLLLGRLVAAHCFLRRRSQRCTPLTAGRVAALAEEVRHQLHLRSAVQLLIDPRRPIPMAFGLFHPKLLLPSDAIDWSDRRLRAVFLHEMAHIARRDIAGQWIAQIACAIYWFNPCVWIAASRLRAARERACDDQVLSAGVEPSNYARHLLDLATTLVSDKWEHACGTAMAQRSALEGRMAALLDPRLNRGAVTAPRAIAASIIALCLVAPLAMLSAAQDESGAKDAQRSADDGKIAQEKSPAATPLPAATPPIGGRPFARQIELLTLEIALARQELEDATRQFKTGIGSSEMMVNHRRELSRLKRELAALQNDFSAVETAIREEMALVKESRNDQEQRIKLGVVPAGSLLGLDRELLRLERELAAAMDKRAHDAHAAAAGPVDGARRAQPGEGSDASQSSDLKEARQKLASLRTKLGDSHPAVKEVSDRIAQLEHEGETSTAVPRKRNIILSAPKAGLIKKVHVERGAKVKKGDSLLLFDDREARSRVETAKAQLAAANAALQLHEIEAKKASDDDARAKALSAEKLISQEEVANKERARAVAHATIQKGRAELALAEQQLQHSLIELDTLTIVSPKDGVVIDVFLAEGERTSSPAHPLFEIGDQ